LFAYFLGLIGETKYGKLLFFGEKMAKLLANQHNLVGRLLNLQKETIKDVNESTSDMHMPLSWDAEPDLSAAVGSMSEASKAVSDCATKLVLVLMVRRKQKGPLCLSSLPYIIFFPPRCILESR
jgi:hypothetical protein